MEETNGNIEAVKRKAGSGKGKWAACGAIGLALGLVLSGCSLLSPPPPIKYLKSLPPNALQNAKPANVRVAINLPKGVQMVDLRLKVTDVSGSTNPSKIRGTLSFQIVPESQALALPPADRSATGVWTYYKLDAEGRSEFRRIQSYMKTHPLGKTQTTIMAHGYNKLKLADCDRKGKMRLVAAILLSPQSGYVVALNRMETVSELATQKNHICASASD